MIVLGFIRGGGGSGGGSRSLFLQFGSFALTGNAATFSGGGGGPAGYTAEDGITPYTAEDGTTPYVQEA